LVLLEGDPKLKVAEASRRVGVSYWKLYRRKQGRVSSSSWGGHNKKLTEVEDKALINHLLMCHYMGKSATIPVVQASANSILRVSGFVATVSRRRAKTWLTRNHTKLQTLRSKPLDVARHSAHNREELILHFEGFCSCKARYCILDDDTYSFDETGCQIGVCAGETAVFVDDLNNKEIITSIECISATGYRVPPVLIFKGAYHLRKFFDNDLDGDILFARSDTGFTSDKLPLKWLHHFDKFTKKRTKGAYRLLIFDGHGSHITQDFIGYCWANQIRPFQLPPHSTHVTQPLDVKVFQSYKHNFQKALNEQVLEGAADFAKDDFFAILNQFSSKTFSEKVCRSAFRSTGLIPYNPSVVLAQLKKYGGTQANREEEVNEVEGKDKSDRVYDPRIEVTNDIWLG
jgi:hypothetical protein